MCRCIADLARSIAEGAAGGPDAGVTLEDLKNALRKSNIYALQDGRYYVALSLAEAESLRAAMHAARREHQEGSSDGRVGTFHLFPPLSTSFHVFPRYFAVKHKLMTASMIHVPE